jgi:hypothetical protein
MLHIYVSLLSVVGLTSQLGVYVGFHIWQVLWLLVSMVCHALLAVVTQQGSSQQVCIYCCFILFYDSSPYDN